ncbi:MAG TPA: FecR family protein [Puia sp.]|jgi:ferric-dicitrate binding protein FerR (iron transport regulator)
MSRLNDLLEKYAAGTCSKEEFEELMQLFKANENEDAIRSHMRKLYSSLERGIISDVHIDEQGDMFKSTEPDQLEEPVPQRRGRAKRTLLVASTIAVIGIATFLYYVQPASKTSNANDVRTISRIYTPAGSKTSVVLPDGSEVWLNSFSTLTYSTAEFNSGKREVTLIGEGMFRVKHDSARPFLVHTKNFDVADLGTVFNVSAYPEDKNGQASLISGSIEVITKGSHAKKIMLIPNQRIIIQNEIRASIAIARTVKPPPVIEPTIRPIILNPQISVAPDTAWMVNKLLFTDESFYDLALQMQRRYQVEIIFKNEKARNYQFTGRFEDEDIEDALKELQAIAPFSYTRSNNEIYIE